MEIKLLETHDVPLFTALIYLFEKEFEMRDFQIPNQEHLSKLLQNEDFKVFVAIEDGQVVGGITLYVLAQYYSIRPQAYIYDLAVASTSQRKGIGTKLVEAVLAFGKNHNFEEVYVQADRVDDHAVAFYNSIPGALEEDVIHFSYRL